MQVLRDTREGENRGESERAKAVFDMRELAAESESRNGKAPHGAMRAGAGVEFSAAESDVRQAQACGCRCGRCPCSLGKGGVK